MLEELLLLSIVCACISFTITEMKLFKPLRELFIGGLFSCGYCLGFWISTLLVLISNFNIFHYYFIINQILTIFVIAWLSAWQWILMCLLFKRVGK